MRTALRLALACLLATGAAACGITNPSDLTTETYTATVTPAGFSDPTYLFSTTKTAEFIVKLTAVSPDSGATFTAIYGTPSPGLCNVINSAPAGLNKTAFDLQLPKGDYCLQMVDYSGSLPRTQSFTATIQHN